MNSDGTWSDYIFANGKRIARADSYDVRLHLHGTCGGNCYVGWQLASMSYVLQSGDTLYWRQYQSGGVAGGVLIQFSDGTDTSGMDDSAGQPLEGLSTDGEWVNRSAVVSGPLVGKTVTGIYVGASSVTADGPFDLYFGDIAIVHPDGTVTTLYDRQMGVTLPLVSNLNNAATNLSAVSEMSNLAGDSDQPVETTSYYLADQIGSTRMVLSAGGWPVAGGTYYPFGVEIGSSASPNHYKFSGKDRDAASGLDDFGARYYSAVMGRFMTPDWSASPEAVPYAKLDNPQSLNLYSYVLNNPLTGIDADGHDPYATKNGAPCGGQSDGVQTDSNGITVPVKSPCAKPRTQQHCTNGNCTKTAMRVPVNAKYIADNSGTLDVPLNPFANAVFHQVARDTAFVAKAEHAGGCTAEAGFAGGATFLGFSLGTASTGDPIGSSFDAAKQSLDYFAKAGGPEVAAYDAYKFARSPAFGEFVGKAAGKFVPFAGELIIAGEATVATTEAVKQFEVCY